jgi:hypothetical protein
MFQSAKRLVIGGVAVALGIALAPTSASAQRENWRTLRIDGSDPERFQATISMLQTTLPFRQRDDFETALALIWFNNTTAADADEDGQYELTDLSELTADSADLLADIRRGDLVAAIEELDESGAAYTAADYFEQLDGFGYDEVLGLAGLFGGTREEAHALRAYKGQLLCRDVSFGYVRPTWCDKFFRSNDATGVPVGETLNRAIDAATAGDDTTVESAIGSLNLKQLTPFERGMAEALLFHVSYRQRLYPKAREHLQAAVDAGVIGAGELEAILGFLSKLEQMSAPDGPSIMAPLPGEQDPTRKLEGR